MTERPQLHFGIQLHIAATSFFSTHHASAADVMTGRERVVTPPTFPLLTGRARRFTSLSIQMHMEVLGALALETIPASVFATVHGEIQTAETLIADFHKNGLVSGARFALSVHNSPSGVYSVATGSTAATTTVTGSNAIAAGWLEAALSDHPIVLSIADEPVSVAFCGPTTQVGVAAGFLLDSRGRRVDLVMVPGSAETEIDTVTTLARIADAISRDEATVIPLGSVRPGTILELHTR